MSDVLPVGLFRVNTPEGERDYVAVATAQQGFEKGLRAEAIVGVLRELFDAQTGTGITPDNFIEGAAFVQLMHGVIARRGAELASLNAEAQRVRSGHVYVIDRRTPTPDGPVPPDDIVGAFAVRAGELGAYSANPKYRLLTQCGFPQLAELQPLLLAELATK